MPQYHDEDGSRGKCTRREATQQDDAHDQFPGRFLFKHPCSPAAQTGWKMEMQESVALESGIVLVDQTSLG